MVSITLTNKLTVPMSYHKDDGFNFNEGVYKPLAPGESITFTAISNVTDGRVIYDCNTGLDVSIDRFEIYFRVTDEVVNYGEVGTVKVIPDPFKCHDENQTFEIHPR